MRSLKFELEVPLRKLDRWDCNVGITLSDADNKSLDLLFFKSIQALHSVSRNVRYVFKQRSCRLNNFLFDDAMSKV